MKKHSQVFPQAKRESEVKANLIAREFMIGAFSAVAGDAIARQVHSESVEHVAQQMGIEPGPNILFPAAFVVLFISIRVPVIIKHRIFKSNIRKRRIHHIIMPTK